MSALLFNAFRALGPAAERREIAKVARALRESGAEEVGRLLNYEEHRRSGTDVVRLRTRPALSLLSRSILRSRFAIRRRSPSLRAARRDRQPGAQAKRAGSPAAGRSAKTWS